MHSTKIRRSIVSFIWRHTKNHEKSMNRKEMLEFWGFLCYNRKMTVSMGSYTD